MHRLRLFEPMMSLTEVDTAWMAEAQRRYQEFKEGHRYGIDARKVFTEIDTIFE